VNLSRSIVAVSLGLVGAATIGCGPGPDSGPLGGSTVEPVQHDQSIEGGPADLAIDESGNGIAVWEQRLAGGSLWSNVYDRNAGWGPSQQVVDADLSAASPSIAATANGDAVAAWSVGETVRAARHARGTGWQGIANLGKGLGGTPIVESAADGIADGVSFIVAAQSGATGDTVTAAIANPGQGWTTLGTIGAAREAGVVGGTAAPDLSVASDGTAMAVWAQDEVLSSTGNVIQIGTAQFTPGSGWQPQQIVPDAEVVYLSDEVKVVARSGGRATVVWLGVSGAGTMQGLWARDLDPNAGGWQAPHLLLQRDVVQPPAGYLVSATKNDRAVLLLLDSSDTFQAFVLGTTGVWQQAEIHGTAKTAPSVAVGSNGDAVAAWTQFVDSLGNDSIFYARFSPTSGWKPVANLLGPSNSGWGPNVAVNGQGDALAIWQGGCTRADFDFCVWGTRIPR